MPDAAYGSGATAAILRARRASLRPAKLNDWSLRSLMEPRNFPLDKDTEMFLKWRSVQRALKTVLRDPIYNKRAAKCPSIMGLTVNRKPSAHSFGEVASPLGSVRSPPDALLERLAQTLSPRMATKRWTRRVSGGAPSGAGTSGETSRVRAEKGGEAGAKEATGSVGTGSGAAIPWRPSPPTAPRLRVSAARRGPRSKWAAPAVPASLLTRVNEAPAKGRCMGSVSSERQLRPLEVAPPPPPRSASSSCSRRRAVSRQDQGREPAAAQQPMPLLGAARSGAAGDPLAPPSSPQLLLSPQMQQLDLPTTKEPFQATKRPSGVAEAAARFQAAEAASEDPGLEGEEERLLLEQAAAVGAARPLPNRPSKEPDGGPPPARDRPPPAEPISKPRSQPTSPLARPVTEVKAASEGVPQKERELPGLRRMRPAASAAGAAIKRTPSVNGTESPREEKVKQPVEAEVVLGQPGRDLEGVLSKWAAETFTEHLEQPFVSEDDIPGLARKAAGPAPVRGSALVSHALLLESLAAMKRARRTRHADAALRGHAGLVRGIRAWAERSLREVGWKGPRLTTTLVPSPPPPPPPPPPGSYPRTRSSVRSTLV